MKCDEHRTKINLDKNNRMNVGLSKEISQIKNNNHRLCLTFSNICLLRILYRFIGLIRNWMCFRNFHWSFLRFFDLRENWLRLSDIFSSCFYLLTPPLERIFQLIELMLFTNRFDAIKLVPIIKTPDRFHF